MITNLEPDISEEASGPIASWEIDGETVEWERLDISSRKLEAPREHFMQRWAQ